jgi:Skp family chaperone for outer membrane proteins
MRQPLTVIAASVIGGVLLALAGGPLGAAPQAGGGFAVIDNARVFEESNQGRAATEQIQANVDSWQQQLATLQTEVQTLLTQRQQQGSIMTPEALRDLEETIQEKQLDLQRRREDAQRQATLIQNQVLSDLETTLTPVVAALASELGYPAVFNSQTPGLLHFEPGIDITDQLIVRLNSMDQ